MKSFVCRWSCPIVTTAVLAAAMLLVNSRLEYCGQSASLQSRVDVVASRSPTPAPRPRTLFVEVHADKPDVEISWAAN